jgi:hypothetical protein
MSNHSSNALIEGNDDFLPIVEPQLRLEVVTDVVDLTELQIQLIRMFADDQIVASNQKLRQI